jgi:serine protease Do
MTSRNGGTGRVLGLISAAFLVCVACYLLYHLGREHGNDNPDPPVPAAAPNAQPSGFADIVERVRPAVVNIYTGKPVATGRKRYAPGRGIVSETRLEQSLGSGFVVDGNGSVVTNHHVIAGASAIEARLLDGRRFVAKVLGSDEKTDIALLQLVEANDVPSVTLGDSESLRVGDWVVAIGNPLGLTSTVTAGIASATGRKRLPVNALRYQDFIQTDASINPGNSGGALVDMNGHVVGVNSAVNQGAQGIGFAIPMHMVNKILPQLREYGEVRRSWLGVFVQPIPDALRTQLDLKPNVGALVSKAVPGGPGDRAGLRAGDVVVKLDDQAVDDADELSWLASTVGIGNSARLELQRGDKRLTLRVVMGRMPGR